MNNILLFCILTAFKIAAVYIAFQPGMILFGVRQAMGKALYKVRLQQLEKPLYDCLPCMSSLWGFFFWVQDGLQYNFVDVLLIICGMLAVLQFFIAEIIEA